MTLEQSLKGSLFPDIVKTYDILYEGKGFSLNALYEAKHWTYRSNIKNKYGKIFHYLIHNAKIDDINEYSITCYYNSRHDPTNVVGMVKVFEDTLAGSPEFKKGIPMTFKHHRYIMGDTKKYCKGIAIFPVDDLKKNSFLFRLQVHD